jgi:hypothetical protein
MDSDRASLHPSHACQRVCLESSTRELIIGEGYERHVHSITHKGRDEPASEFLKRYWMAWITQLCPWRSTVRAKCPAPNCHVHVDASGGNRLTGIEPTSN